jgi:PHD/YefM family antitoxin component YafN of YafNO toxin-antitoxin module
MKTVSMKEFREQANRVVSDAEPVIVEKHGKPVGVYLPLKSSANKLRAYEAAQEMDRLLQEVSAKVGLTPDEYLDEIEAAVAEEKAREQGKLL